MAFGVLDLRDMKEPVRRHESLIAWQLCSRLRRLVLGNVRSGPAAKDFDYRLQLRKAVRSACYNTSEGFYRYHHGQFGHQLNIARASLGEALDQIDEGLEHHYFTGEQHLEMKRICLRAVKANAALRRSWGDREAPGSGSHRSNRDTGRARPVPLEADEPKPRRKYQAPRRKGPDAP